ncbi:DUF3017 domain-containing protein [Streptomyces sp. YC504]|uniref:DUF3017 domain-containing protein n=1 Tax=Streptomyces mesophilus TaxID=1775132 RepID=A0A6G4XN67_9ACTN|nr:DUF3017 domain-containing protein [Streptomyces mesophilus]NGO78673.1 DUF3017 domain-containing protein [Streptomyces mesophilus]
MPAEGGAFPDGEGPERAAASPDGEGPEGAAVSRDGERPENAEVSRDGERPERAVSPADGDGHKDAEDAEDVAGAEDAADAESAQEPAEPTARSAVSGGEPPVKKSRRFPLFTKDTARPEGGGRAAPGDAPAPARQWPMLTVLGVTAAGLILTAFDVWRIGTLLIGVALLIGAVLRRMLPSVGMLAVRSRFTDMVTYGALGVAIVLLALMAQPKPVLEIPFLDETLHFTISS